MSQTTNSTLGTHLAMQKIFGGVEEKKNQQTNCSRLWRLFKPEIHYPTGLTNFIVLFQTQISFFKMLLSFSKPSLNSLQSKSLMARECPSSSEFHMQSKKKKITWFCYKKKNQVMFIYFRELRESTFL